MNADGEKQRALTQVSATSPTWASNGKQIYLSTEMMGGVKVPTLFAVDVDGENPKKLTDAGQTCEEPDGSPDGQWIAYVSVQDANKDIYLIRAAGGDLRKLTEESGTGIFSGMGAIGISCFTERKCTNGALGNT